MNIYKVTFNGTCLKHVVAKSFSQVEEIWTKDEGRYQIDIIELVEQGVDVADK